MKNYSRARASRGKTAYRTSSVFRYRRSQKIKKDKAAGRGKYEK